MAARSAGLLVYKFIQKRLSVFLVHPGGPFFINKDRGTWSVPKGEYDSGDALEAAKREFEEETGQTVHGEFFPLPEVRSKAGKRVVVFAVEGDVDPLKVKSNFFDLEWPPRSGKTVQFPEVDKGAWFTLEEAKDKIVGYQQPLLNSLYELMKQT